MTHFEYIAVIVSIILGLGIVRLLGSLEQVFSQDRYWPHSIWVISIFWMQVQNWWAFWDMRTVSFNVALYAMWIGYASLCYLCTVSLTNRSGSEVAWREHYYAQRKWLFGVLIPTIIVAIFTSFVFFGTSLLHPYRLFQLSLLLLVVLGFFIAKENVHRVISVLFAVAMIVGVLIFRYLPDLFVVQVD